MKSVIFSGPPDSGKTGLLEHLRIYLTTRSVDPYQVIDYVSPSFYDFSCLLEGRGGRVIIHSATDDWECINNLMDYMARFPNADMLITTCRSYPDSAREWLCNRMGWYSGWLITDQNGNVIEEIPLGKIRSSKDNVLLKWSRLMWYQGQMNRLAVKTVTGAPYYL